MNLRSHSKNLRKAMLRRYGKLDGLGVLTEQDRAAYESALDGAAPPIWRLPNTVRAIEPPRADLAPGGSSPPAATRRRRATTS